MTNYMKNYTGINKKKLYDCAELVLIYTGLIFRELRINFGKIIKSYKALCYSVNNIITDAEAVLSLYIFPYIWTGCVTPKLLC